MFQLNIVSVVGLEVVVIIYNTMFLFLGGHPFSWVDITFIL